MKKLALLSLLSILFLSAMAKPQEVVSFLRPVAEGLKENTNVPVILPTYWSEQTGKSKMHTSVKVKAYENGYMIYFLSRINRIEQTIQRYFITLSLVKLVYYLEMLEI